jgi:hypothetical protein
MYLARGPDTARQARNIMTRRVILPDRLPDYGIKIGDKQRKRHEAAGLFPRRVPLSARSHGYVEDELIEHIQQCIARRDGAGEAA